MKTKKFKIAFVALALVSLFMNTSNTSAQSSLVGTSTGQDVTNVGGDVTPYWPGIWFGGFSLRVCVGWMGTYYGDSVLDRPLTASVEPTDFSKFDIR